MGNPVCGPLRGLGGGGERRLPSRELSGLSCAMGRCLLCLKSLEVCAPWHEARLRFRLRGMRQADGQSLGVAPIVGSQWCRRWGGALPAPRLPLHRPPCGAAPAACLQKAPPDVRSPPQRAGAFTEGQALGTRGTSTSSTCSHRVREGGAHGVPDKAMRCVLGFNPVF